MAEAGPCGQPPSRLRHGDLSFALVPVLPLVWLQEVPEVDGLPAEDVAAWRLQATLMARLPQVCACACLAIQGLQWVMLAVECNGRVCRSAHALPPGRCHAAGTWTRHSSSAPRTPHRRPSPQACSAAFKAVDADAQRRWPERGGTTATLAIACGWELLVANVGDSCAYLDTGSEVLQASVFASVGNFCFSRHAHD